MAFTAVVGDGSSYVNPMNAYLAGSQSQLIIGGSTTASLGSQARVGAVDTFLALLVPSASQPVDNNTSCAPSIQLRSRAIAAVSADVTSPWQVTLSWSSILVSLVCVLVSVDDIVYVPLDSMSRFLGEPLAWHGTTAGHTHVVGAIAAAQT